jgi:hypothetical protein
MVTNLNCNSIDVLKIFKGMGVIEGILDQPGENSSLKWDSKRNSAVGMFP